MRKIIPLAVAALVFLVAVALIQPEPSKDVVIAAVDMSPGHLIQAEDITTSDFPEALVPADSFGSAEDVIGQTLAVGRSEGDIIRTSNLGEPVRLGSNERAVAVRVSDSSGMAGLIKPGDIVGVVATIRVIEPGGESGSFSKSTIEPLRVLYLSPEFEALDVDAEPQVDSLTGLTQKETRVQEGTVVLAVPIDQQVVLYDFSARLAPDQVRWVNAIELLAALDSSGDASLSLYLVPDGAADFETSGLFLPDLVITPGPTPTNTPTPTGPIPPTPTLLQSTPTPEAGS